MTVFKHTFMHHLTENDKCCFLIKDELYLSLFFFLFSFFANHFLSGAKVIHHKSDDDTEFVESANQKVNFLCVLFFIFSFFFLACLHAQNIFHFVRQRIRDDYCLSYTRTNQKQLYTLKSNNTIRMDKNVEM